jgi:photosystem II reaction center protein PsbM
MSLKFTTHVHQTESQITYTPLSTNNKKKQVTFAAYLAVLLGTFVPVAFLIILFIQSESRKAGEAAGRGD